MFLVDVRYTVRVHTGLNYVSIILYRIKYYNRNLSCMLLLITADSFNKHDRIVSEVHEDPPCQHSRTWYFSSKSGKIRQHEIQKSHEVNRYMYVHLFCYKGYMTECVTSRDFSKEKHYLSNICALHMVKVIFTESFYSESKWSFEHYHDY